MKLWQWFQRMKKFAVWQAKLVWNDYADLCGLCGGAQNLFYLRKGVMKWIICPACNGRGCYNEYTETAPGGTGQSK